MKKFKTVLILILVIVFALIAYFSFSSNKKTNDVSEDTSSAASFNFSDSIDDNGFWKNITALDYVKLCEYVGISIPSDIHEISDESV